MVRFPAVAGTFYPANPKQLREKVEEYLAERARAELVRAKACLVPHAGYLFSGHVAGAVFAEIEIPETILLLGVRHAARGAELAILTEGAWRTPLGDAPIAEELAKKLKMACPALEEDEVAHEREHSLEVELPFLQVLRPEMKLVPVAVGGLDLDELVKTGEEMGRVVRESEEEILIVTSSDLNHYEDEETTQRKDRDAIGKLEEMDARGLYEVCRRGRISMCGLGPSVVALSALRMMGVKKARLVRHATSGEVNGDYSAVVGYAGMIFE